MLHSTQNIPDIPRWLYLDLNSYFASVEQQLDPTLRGKPVAVVPVESDATCAIAASYEAKAYGIKTGTMIYEAKKRCPDLICVLAEHQKYVLYHHQIMQVIHQHIPIDTVCSIDEVACKLMDNEQSPDYALALGKRIKQAIYDQVGEVIRCSIGLGPNRFLAKVASNIQKPDGLIWLKPSELPDNLSIFQLEDIPGIGRGMSKRLAFHGIGSIEDLWRLSPKHMRSVWHSVNGERFWYSLRGHDLPDIETKRRTVGHSHVLSPEWRPLDDSRIVAKRLLLKAASRLRRKHYYAKALTISVRIEKGPKYAIEQQFAPLCDSLNLGHIFHIAWSSLITDIRRRGYKRIKKVSITLHKLIPESDVDLQADLLDAIDNGQINARKRNEALSHAMDSLNQKYGRETVLMGLVQSEENSFTGTKISFTRIPEIQEFEE